MIQQGQYGADGEVMTLHCRSTKDYGNDYLEIRIYI